MLALAVLLGGLYALFAVLFSAPVAAGLLRDLFVGSWPTIDEIFLTALFSALGGLVIGLIRFRWKHTDGVVAELIATAASPDTLKASGLGAVAVGLHIALGLFGGAVAGALGATAFEVNPGTAVGLALAASVGGPGGGDFFPLLILLVALVLLILAITLLLSLGIGTVGFSMAKGAALGAGAGGARALGELAALTLTRLGTVQLTAIAKSTPPGPLTPAQIVEAYLATLADPVGRTTIREWVADYDRWLAGAGPPPDSDAWRTPVHRYIAQSPRWREYHEYLAYYNTLPKYPRYSVEWSAQHEARKRLRLLDERAKAEKAALEQYAEAAAAMKRARDPNARMSSTNNAPVFDGTSATLFYPGAWKTAVRQATVSGLWAGAVTAMIACLMISIRA